MMARIIILPGILLALFGALKRKETYGKILFGLGIIITILGVGYFIYAINMPVRLRR
jgi:hypothetical protein